MSSPYQSHCLKHLGPMANFMVISDVHLRAPHSPLAHVFLETLKKASACQALFLLGDIFDFIFVGKKHFLEKWQPVWQALELLKSQGTQVYFLEGNHDFGFSHFPTGVLDACFTAYGDFDALITHPTLGPIILSHGDRVVCPWHYPIFRRWVKSKWLQRVAKIIPGSLMDVLFHTMASLSRSRDRYQTLDPHFLFTKAHGLGASYMAPTVILGHVHVYTDATVGGIRVVTGPDWPHCPNYAHITADGLIHRSVASAKPLPPPMESPAPGPWCLPLAGRQP